MCSYKKVFWKYPANLQENTHTKVWFQYTFSLEHLWTAVSVFSLVFNVLPRTFLKAFEDPLMPPTFSLSISLHFIFTEFPSFFSKNYFLFCILLLNQKKQTSSAVLRYLEKSLKTRKSSVFFSWRLCGSYFTENQIHHRHFPGSFRQCPGHKKPLSSYFYQQQVLCTVCE